MASLKLNIHFHNPNSEEDTYKIISGVLADLCVKKIKKMIVEDIYKLINTGKLPAVKVGRVIRIAKSNIEKISVSD